MVFNRCGFGAEAAPPDRRTRHEAEARRDIAAALVLVALPVSADQTTAGVRWRVVVPSGGYAGFAVGRGDVGWASLLTGGASLAIGF